MQLTRRDAVAALAAVGVAAGGGTAAYLVLDGEDGRSVPDGPISDDQVATVRAAAAVLYPSAVEDVDAFVVRYLRGLADGRRDRLAGVAGAADYLDDYADAWEGQPFAALDPETRTATLRDMGVDTADPDPAGSDVERVRFFVVNELLYALYTSPTGGKLVGLENPQGHPGGLASYRVGPGDTGAASGGR